MNCKYQNLSKKVTYTNEIRFSCTISFPDVKEIKHQFANAGEKTFFWKIIRQQSIINVLKKLVRNQETGDLNWIP